MIWNRGSFAQRSTMKEPIDDPNISDRDLNRLFDFHAFCGRRLGGDKIILERFEDWAERWMPQAPITILELHCGRGDLSRAIVRWARRNNIDVQLLGVDFSERAIHLAREHHHGFKELVFETKNPKDSFFFHAQQFDYVISSLALHRADGDDAVIAQLKTMNLLAKRGVIVCDWLRDPRAVAWMGFAGKFFRNAAVSAEISAAIHRGFTVDEIASLAEKAGLNYARVQKHFGYRFSLSGERGVVLSPQLNPWARFAGT